MEPSDIQLPKVGQSYTPQEIDTFINDAIAKCDFTAIRILMDGKQPLSELNFLKICKHFTAHIPETCSVYSDIAKTCLRNVQTKDMRDSKELITAFIKENIDINAVGEDGLTLFQRACRDGNLSLVKALVTESTIPSDRGDLLPPEARIEHTSSLLHSFGGAQQKPGLFLAIEAGQDQVVNFLLDSYPCEDLRDSNNETVLQYALRADNPALLEKVFTLIVARAPQLLVEQNSMGEIPLSQILRAFPRAIESLPIEFLGGSIALLSLDDLRKSKDLIHKRLHSIQDPTEEQVTYIKECEKLLSQIEKMVVHTTSTGQKKRRSDHLVHQIETIEETQNIRKEIERWLNTISRYTFASMSPAVGLSKEKKQQIEDSAYIIESTLKKIQLVIADLQRSGRSPLSLFVCRDGQDKITQGVAVALIEDTGIHVDLLATHPRNLNLKWSERAATGTGTAILASVAKYVLDHDMKSITLRTLSSSKVWYLRLGFRQSESDKEQLTLDGDALEALAKQAQ